MSDGPTWWGEFFEPADIGEFWQHYNPPEWTPDYWSNPESELFERALDGMPSNIADRMANDEWMQFLQHEALWDRDIPADQREGIYDAFEDYVRETYGIEWDDYYDWDDFRKAYEMA